MNRSPDRLNLDHLKKQAKDLIRLYRSRDAGAIARFRAALPAAAGRSDEEIASLGLAPARRAILPRARTRFRSWPDLKRYVEAQAASRERARGARPALAAARLFRRRQRHGQPRQSPRCAARCSPRTRISSPTIPILPAPSATKPRCGRRPRPIRPGSTGPAARCDCRRWLRSRIRACCACRSFASACIDARELLLAAGADPNQHIVSRWPPASLEQPDPRLSAVGALWRRRQQSRSGAHADCCLKPAPIPTTANRSITRWRIRDCARLLLEHGARISRQQCDLPRDRSRRSTQRSSCCWQHGGDPNEPAHNAPLTDWGSPLLWAIRRRRLAATCEALLEAGADPVRHDAGWRQRLPAGAAVRARRRCGPAAGAGRRA